MPSFFHSCELCSTLVLQNSLRQFEQYSSGKFCKISAQPYCSVIHMKNYLSQMLRQALAEDTIDLKQELQRQATSSTASWLAG